MNRSSNPTGFQIRQVDWSSAEFQLRAIRQQVFIKEQRVPIELEWDGLDEQATHLLAVNESGCPIGCARILDNGIIGRMAVLPEWRRQGVGKALLEKAINVCRGWGCSTISLSAQTHAIPFYERAGFSVCSGEYLDAGIPHCDMRLG